jgi:flagellin
MALTVRTNVGALSAIRTLNNTQNSLTKSLGRISTGSRINSAADDAAGLSVSSRMKSDNVSLKAAMRNTNDGISLIQTAEGGLNEVYSILTRMRELTVQASNDTYSTTDRNQIKIEFGQLRDEISRITSDANFNRITILSSTKTLKFQIGINNAANNQFSIAMTTINSSIGALNISAGNALIAATTAAASLAAMRSTITTIDTALSSVNDKRARLGSFQNRLESALNTASNYSQNLSAAASGISDVDYASESANMTKFQIMQQAGVAALGQAKSIPQSILSLLG